MDLVREMGDWRFNKRFKRFSALHRFFELLKDQSISNIPGMKKVVTYLIKSEESFNFQTVDPFFISNDFPDLCVVNIDSVIEI